MERKANKVIDKEIYGWNVNDIFKIVDTEFKPHLPEDLRDMINYDGITEGIEMYLEEIFDNDEIIPEFVKEYQERRPNEYLVHTWGIGEDNDDYICVVTTFEPEEGDNHKNRLLHIDIYRWDGELKYRISYVK